MRKTVPRRHLSFRDLYEHPKDRYKKAEDATVLTFLNIEKN